VPATMSFSYPTWRWVYTTGSSPGITTRAVPGSSLKAFQRRVPHAEPTALQCDCKASNRLCEMRSELLHQKWNRSGCPRIA
jgi:hypothetical protein